MPHSSRRHFLKVSGLAAATTSLIGTPTWAIADHHSTDMTIRQAIDTIISQIPGGKTEQTVDTTKSGDPTVAVTGIVSTFLATTAVIREAIANNANLIITHEPTYYNHTDETDWLENDPVYQYKRKLLEDNNIVVWRFHDYWHRHRPDGILHGFLDKMNWQEYLDTQRENICVIPTMSLKKLAKTFKKRLELDRCFYVGNADLQCRNIGILPGAWGRNPHIELLRTDIEVLVIGEAAEWETVEYVRDAAEAGMNKGLIVLGHAMSEEPGMAYVVDWLKGVLPGVPAYHVAAHDPFQPV